MPVLRWLAQPDPSWWAGDVTRSGRIAWQFDNRANHPITMGALERKLLEIKWGLGSARFSLRNWERTNRLLVLRLLQANGVADENARSSPGRG